VATPLGLVLFQAATDTNGALRKRNQERLRQLKRASSREITIFCAHDAGEFDACCAGRPL
jgi:hypothetical protein